jgi:hypothetical protein
VLSAAEWASTPGFSVGTYQTALNLFDERSGRGSGAGDPRPVGSRSKVAQRPVKGLISRGCVSSAAGRDNAVFLLV